MRNGSLILFWTALIVAAFSFVTAVAQNWDTVSGDLAPPYEDDSGSASLLLLMALTAALSSAAWPFFGSALLWLLDNRLLKLEAAE
jgi:hypothetical protein